MIKFDETNPNWVDNDEYNTMFIRSREQYLNDLLRVRGYLTHMDILDWMGVKFDIEKNLSKTLSELTVMYDKNKSIVFTLYPLVDRSILIETNIGL